MKSNINKQSMKAVVTFLSKSGLPYNLSVSNYTVAIKSEYINAKFMKSSRSYRFFGAYNRIKADVSKHAIPKIRKHEVEFFEHDFRSNFFTPEITNIDLSNAYATILYNEGYITEKTFKHLSKLHKSERLGSIGMLASKKYSFDYDESGQIAKYTLITGKYENFFFYCAKKTQEIMRDLRKICGKNFLFIWVDSVYFRPDPEIEALVKEHITLSGFKFKRDLLKDFAINIVNGKVKLTFIKEGKATYFFIPPKTSEFSDSIATFLTDKNYHNENYNFRVSPRASSRV